MKEKQERAVQREKESRLKNVDHEYEQASFYTHPGGPWHALFLPGPVATQKK